MINLSTKIAKIASLSGLFLTAAALTANAQVNTFNLMVGTWVDYTAGYEISIEADGRVFARGSDYPLSGSAGRCIDGGANFCFEGSYGGQPFRCAYSVAFLSDPNQMMFRATTDRTKWCPSGAFARTR